ncbi:MAG: flagellar motor stator protein MotA [Betaproteobacteria bacterium]|jgi:chemotaxis protein MotA|nr:flagellar motor stator protein MotA [Betaproteobacteria bacterium]
MFIAIGYIITLGSIFGGFVLAGGHLAALFQPLELLMIFGGAAGAFVAGNTGKNVKATLKAFPALFKGPAYSKAVYIDLLAMLFEVLAKVRKEGLMSIESDVEEPEKSAIFSKYPKVMSDHHVVEFLTDYLRMMVGGNLNVFEIEALMDSELESHHKEEHGPADALAKLGDGMPAFGIVAAVMGVVHTMESLHLPPEELGLLIAHALVGTFLGILLSYGMVAPLAALHEQKVTENSKIYDCIKAVLLASMNGYAPPVAVEFGRKVLFSTDRPGFRELEEEIKNRKGK